MDVGEGLENVGRGRIYRYELACVTDGGLLL